MTGQLGLGLRTFGLLSIMQTGTRLECILSKGKRMFEVYWTKFYSTPGHNPHWICKHFEGFERYSSALLVAEHQASRPWIKNVWISDYNDDGDEVNIHVIKRTDE
jgi:hypothetical protein